MGDGYERGEETRRLVRKKADPWKGRSLEQKREDQRGQRQDRERNPQNLVVTEYAREVK